MSTTEIDSSTMPFTDFEKLYKKHGSERKVAKFLGIARTTLQDRKKAAYKRIFVTQKMKPARVIRPKKHTQIFILSAAQDTTKVHQGFLKNLEAYAEYRDAEIIISGYTYNKSLFSDHSKQGGTYAKSIEPYLENGRVLFGDDLMFCAEVNTLPTAVSPLSGMQTYSGEASAVFPHSKYQLDSIPVDKDAKTKIIQTTGAVTLPNYIMKKAGQKAEFHHIIGAAVVELLPDGRFFVRHIAAEDNGNFQDLGYRVKKGKVKTDATVLSATWGDIHHEKIDDNIAASCWGVGPKVSKYAVIMDTLRPKYSFIHDIIDFKPRNHHNIADPHFMFEMHTNGEGNVSETLDKAAEFLLDIQRSFTETVVIESNHDLALLKWLKNADYRYDPENAIFFLEAQAQVYRAIRDKNTKFQILKWAFERHLGEVGESLDATWLGEDESFIIAHGIQCGAHGHLGANGTRGSALQFSRTGRRSNTAHTHSATVRDGSWVAGVSGSLEMGYNKGLSSWSHSHIITMPSGKRQMVTQYPDGLWCSDALLRGSKWHD